MGQNCRACGRTRKGTEPGCLNYAAWLTPEVACERCQKILWVGLFSGASAERQEKGQKSLCDRIRKCLNCCSVYQVDPKKPHKCFHAACPNCGEFQHVDHRCFIQPVAKEKETGNEDPDFDAPPVNEDSDEEHKNVHPLLH